MAATQNRILQDIQVLPHWGPVWVFGLGAVEHYTSEWSDNTKNPKDLVASCSRLVVDWGFIRTADIDVMGLKTQDTRKIEFSCVPNSRLRGKTPIVIVLRVSQSFPLKSLHFTVASFCPACLSAELYTHWSVGSLTWVISDPAHTHTEAWLLLVNLQGFLPSYAVI